MAGSQLLEDNVQLYLLSTMGQAGLAVDILAQKYGLKRDHAESVVELGSGILIPQMTTAQAKEAAGLMQALGLQVAIQPAQAATPEELFDVSVHVHTAHHAIKILSALQRVTGLSDLSIESFQGPEGLVLSSLNGEEARRIELALHKVAGAYVVLAKQRTSHFDLFASRPLRMIDALEVRRYLRVLGCAGSNGSDAIACDLDRDLLARVLRQFPGLGLFGANQAFQRHELLITGKGCLSPREFTDFLLTRPASAGIAIPQLLDALPLCDEAWLTRNAALQFLSDYSSIGIEAKARLVGLGGARGENA